MRTTHIRPLVPVQPEPAQSVDDAGHHVPRGTLGIGVLDAEDEGAAMATGVEPVEQRRPRAADVQVAGWRRSESNANHRLILDAEGAGAIAEGAGAGAGGART